MDEIKANRQRYPATCQDQFNYAARYGSTKCNQIQAVLELDGHLDSEHLQKAFRLVVEAEPILACRFIEADPHPYWERRQEFGPGKYFSISETRDPEVALQDCLARPMEVEDDPGIQLELIRNSPKDCLVIKVNHACTDGSGVKTLVQQLADVYTRLKADPDYHPVYHGGAQRDQAQLFQELGINDYEAVFDPGQITPQATWAFPNYPGEPATPHVTLRRLTVDQFNAVAQVAKHTGAGINNVILTAFYRALFKMLAPAEHLPVEITVTVDLRQYLAAGKTETLCNLSGAVNTQIARIAGESFQATLLRVIPVMTGLKQHRTGVQMAIFFELLGKMEFPQLLDQLRGIQQGAKSSGVYSPMLSNLGVLSREFLQFGHCLVREAFLVTPPLCAPAFMLGVSTYRDALTLAVSYYEPVTRQADVEQFLDLIYRELTGLGE